MARIAATMRHGLIVSLVTFSGALAISGCNQQSATATNPAPPAQAAAAPAGSAPALRLPFPIRDFMRASVEIPADGIWAAQGASMLSDDEWLLADQDSADLAAAATFMNVPGTGKDDEKWVANDDWKMWAADVQKTALQIRDAVKAKDLMKLSDGADHLAETCQACHDKYRPEAPSDGIARFPFYPKRVLAPKK
jgi:cytochrome c'